MKHVLLVIALTLLAACSKPPGQSGEKDSVPAAAPKLMVYYKEILSTAIVGLSAEQVMESPDMSFAITDARKISRVLSYFQGECQAVPAGFDDNDVRLVLDLQSSEPRRIEMSSFFYRAHEGGPLCQISRANVDRLLAELGV